MDKKLLSISLLVSGREDTTEKCLNSIKPLLDQLNSELILVDTGCNGKMQELLKKYTDKIIPFSWCNDFAKARNAGIAQAQGQWFLYLDDDEWFEDVTPIIEFFNSGESNHYDQAVYYARNYSTLDGSDYQDEWVSRMIRLEEDTRFEGKVHESLVPARGNCKRLEAFVHHYGYVFCTEEERQNHFKRNVSLLLELIKEEPNDLRWRLQILQEYDNIGDGVSLEQAARDALLLLEELDKPFANQCRGAFYTAVLEGLFLQKEFEACIEEANGYLEDNRNNSYTICSITAKAVEAAEKILDSESVVEFAEKYFNAYEVICQEELSEQERIIQESIVLVKDAVTDNCAEFILETYIENVPLIESKTFVLESLKKKVEKKVDVLLNGNGEFLFLPERYWNFAKVGVISLEEKIVNLPLSQWMVMVLVLQHKNSKEIWEKTYQHLALVQTKEDVRFDYFYMSHANYLVCNENECDYETWGEILTYFAEANVSYAQKVYSDKAFEGKQEILPNHCRAALEIERMFSCNETDWNGRLEYLGKAVKIWPEMGETVKKYAKLLGEEQEKIEDKAKEARSELQIMAEQIKAQVKVMLENGMKDQALEIVKQLRQMLPDDKEIAKLEKELGNGIR